MCIRDRIEEIYEGGLVAKVPNGRRYARWAQVVQIERKLMRTTVFIVHLADGDRIKVVPAADGVSTAQQIIEEIVARAGFEWKGSTATRRVDASATAAAAR